MTTSASKMQPAKMLMGMILLVSQASASSMKTIITNDATLAARTVEARQAGADITTLKFGNLAGSFAMTQVEALKTLDHPLATVTTIETTVAGKSVSTVLPLIVGPSGWIWSAIPDADMSYPYWPVPTAPTGPRMCLVHDGCGSPPVATTAITTAHPSTETGAAKQWTCVEWYVASPKMATLGMSLTLGLALESCAHPRRRKAKAFVPARRKPQWNQRRWQKARMDAMQVVTGASRR